MKLKTREYTIDELMVEYLNFCQYCSASKISDSDKFGNFIGWLKQKEIKR